MVYLLVTGLNFFSENLNNLVRQILRWPAKTIKVNSNCQAKARL